MGGGWAAGFPTLWVLSQPMVIPSPQPPNSESSVIPDSPFQAPSCSNQHPVMQLPSQLLSLSILTVSLYYPSLHTYPWRTWYVHFCICAFRLLHFCLPVLIPHILCVHFHEGDPPKSQLWSEKSSWKSFNRDFDLRHCQGRLTRSLNLYQVASTRFSAPVVSWFPWLPSRFPLLSSAHDCEHTPSAFAPPSFST